MLTIHHLANSQSERVIWLCEELGLEYALQRYEREPTMAAPLEFKALHPAGTAPTIIDEGAVLAETGAVFEYILARYGNSELSVSVDEPGYLAYLFWLHFANGSMMPSQLVAAVLGSLPGSPGSHFASAVMARIGHACAMMEEQLATSPYLGGEAFTAADIMMVFSLTSMTYFVPLDLTPYPHIRAYLDRVTARPAYGRAKAKAEPAGGELR
jgi:glutathione S-transferase